MVKIFVLIAVSITLIYVCPIAAQSQRPSPGTGKEIKPPQNQSPTQQQKPESDKRGTEQMPFVVKAIPTPKSQVETEQERKDQKEKTSQGWWTIWLTGVVAAATFLQAIFLIRSFRETKKAANAAKKSAIVAEDTLRITQRAYLDITDHQIYRRLTPGNNPQITYEITNIGNTVAQITEIMHVVDIVSEFPLDPDYSKCKIMSKNYSIRQKSTASKIATMDRPINADQISSLDNDTKFLGLWGKITYYDIFQKSFTIGFGIKYRPRAGRFAFIDGYNYIKEHEEKEQS